jgi:hypothetical protein
MIKCPNCGSTAQVRMGEPTLSRNKCYITLPCECGCGCHFDLDYDVEDFCSRTTHYVDKEMRLIK